jgi:coenzyme A diphosphatase NUDT7
MVPQPILNSAEVATLFSHPLASLLTTEPPFPSEPDTLEVPYHTSWDYKGGGPPDQIFRVHQFLTGREAGGIKPVFGLTAYVSFLYSMMTLMLISRAILIRVATIGYARKPDFEVYPPAAVSNEGRMAYALLNRKVFRDACKKENINLLVAKSIVESGVRREQERVIRKYRNKL